MNEEAYKSGLVALKRKNYIAAERDFRAAFDSIGEQHASYNRFASYLGLARVLISDSSGLLLCRDAASNETRDGDVFLVLACAEWHTNNRERALDAINRGRIIDRAHTQLVRAGMLLDTRRRKTISFLPRDNLLNRVLGRLVRVSPARVSVHSLLY